MQSAPQKAHVDVVGGLAAVAPRLGLDGEAVVAHYPMFALATEGPVRVTIGSGFDWLSVMGQRKDSPDPGGDRRELFVELEARRGATEMVTIEHRFGAAVSGIDGDWLENRGVEDEVVAEALRRAQILQPSGECSGVTWRRTAPEQFELHLRMWRRDSDSLGRILAAMTDASLHPAAAQLIGRIHPILAKKRAMLVSLPLMQTQLLPRLALTYGDIAFEDVLRLLTGAFPDGDFARHIGELAGAFGVDVASAFTLELGAVLPFAYRISVDVA